MPNRIVCSASIALAVAAGPAAAQEQLRHQASRDPVYETTLRSIAEAIEALKPDYPQLEEFSVARNFDAAGLRITYAFRTGPPRGGPGWSGSFLSPKDDGINLYLDLHDPKSNQHLHSQPVVPRFRFRDQAVLLLLLEGPRTKPLRAPIVRSLTDKGAQPVRRSWTGEP